MGYEMNYPLPIEASRSERAGFIRRTYAHLAGAILAFVAIQVRRFFQGTPPAPPSNPEL